MNLKKKLVMSVTSLATVLAIGAGATYALISSNTATISANEIDTGNAAIKLCRRPTNQWLNSFTGFTLTGLLPGDTDKDLTGGQNVFVGNDNGGLAALDSCAYGADPASTSDVSMKLIPTIVNLAGANCTSAAKDDIQLNFIIGATASGYGSLNFWTTNTTQYGDVVAPNGTAQIQVLAKMVSTSTQTAQKCTFGLQFTGVQQP